ncbi:MAG: hypothetical protein FJW35_14805 [Acidobacteria bacterium]|nr:hypothetical protein [Acidobacteriota bacterium]
MSADAPGVPGPESRRRLHVLRGQSTGQPMLTDIGISRRREDGLWDQPVRLGAAVGMEAFQRPAPS